jgi:hypothetical protein
MKLILRNCKECLATDYVSDTECAKCVPVITLDPNHTYIIHKGKVYVVPKKNMVNYPKCEITTLDCLTIESLPEVTQ